VGAMTMAMKTKVVIAAIVVVIGSWTAWSLRGRPTPSMTNRESGVPTIALPPPVNRDREPTTSEPTAVRVDEESKSKGNGEPTTPTADERPPKTRSALIERLRSELTNENLGHNNVEDDLGAEVRAALHGLSTESFDLDALLTYVESRLDNSWVVRDS